MVSQRTQRRLTVIQATDIVGYSRLMEADEAATLDQLRTLRQELFDPKLAEFGGRIVKTMGDGVLAEFASAVDAVEHAIDIQTTLAERNADVLEDRRIVLRIGINIGDVVVEDDDIFGDGVNVAARLEGLAEPGSIYVSDDVRRQVDGKVRAAFDDLGEQSLKNIERRVRVYPVAAAPSEGAGNSDDDEKLQLSDRPSIAVLPFDNMSGDPEQEYFSDGIAEDLITALSRIRHFDVVARNTTFSYKGSSPNIREVSRELGARYVVEGSVRKSGNRVRVSAQLIDGTTGNHVWAERYDRDLEDIFAVQDELTLTLVAAIEPEMNKSERQCAVTNRTENLDAWELYHRGMWHMSRQTSEDFREASSLFERAMELDRNFAPAHAAYAQCYARNYLMGSYEGDRDRALKAARHAVELDNEDSMAHLSLGHVQMIDRDHERAIAEFETATRFNPGSAQAHHFLGTALVHAGRAEDALPHLAEALRLSPADPNAMLFNSRIALAHLYLGDNDSAAEWSEKPCVCRARTGQRVRSGWRRWPILAVATTPPTRSRNSCGFERISPCRSFDIECRRRMRPILRTLLKASAKPGCRSEPPGDLCSGDGVATI